MYDIEIYLTTYEVKYFSVFLCDCQVTIATVAQTVVILDVKKGGNY